MAKQSRRADAAAKRFFHLLVPDAGQWEYSDHNAKPLILSAFKLYAEAWGGDFNIQRWEYPFATLESGEAFTGDEPWTVLLRRAVEICR